ncbi:MULTISPECIES: hypothetical protein [Methylomicrobium]|uniref:hypothetical protein n=1 Tax=Methylomicrobium TaxID=39773 RepID=UPI00020D8AA1|nr:MULTISPECIES: hypothetical protein [Methylomicrobium]
MTQPYFFRLPILMLIALLTGCAWPWAGNLSGTGLSKKEFARYVEEVFRFQNRMTSEVMMLTATDEGNDFSGLLKSEQRMQLVCAPLNEYVSRDIEGLGSGLGLQRQVAKTAFDCDRAAHEVDRLLKLSRPPFGEGSG